MESKRSSSRGEDLERRLEEGGRAIDRAPVQGARQTVMLSGVRKDGSCNTSIGNVLVALSATLNESKRVFVLHTEVVMVSGGEQPRLKAITENGDIKKGASAVLSNLVNCQVENPRTNVNVEFPLPYQFLQTALSDEALLASLPSIKLYARRPVFDSNFAFCGPGWHPESQYLVHCDAIELAVPSPAMDAERVLDRLPPLLREVLADFPFKSEVDLINAVGAILTGLIVNHFILDGKPLFVLDGNQPGVGKTLFAQVIATLLDGKASGVIRYTSDEAELEKQICAVTRKWQVSVLVFDNARDRCGEIANTTLEALCSASELNLRVLGTSTMHTRPNDLLWFLTMNQTKLAGDMMARACPIQFHVDGNPVEREISHYGLIRFVQENRNELLAEALGMIEQWNAAGRPLSDITHRHKDWARTIGGVLEANRLNGFLSNLNEAKTEFSVESQEFSALAQFIVRRGFVGHDPLMRQITDGVEPRSESEFGHTASQLTRVFLAANVMRQRLENAPSDAARAASIGQFLCRNLNQSVEIDLGGPDESDTRQGIMTLRRRNGRANQKHYYFDLTIAPRDENLSAPTPVVDLTPPCTSQPSTDVNPVSGPVVGGEASHSPSQRQGGNGMTW